MQLDTTTLALQALNFLVLLWLLKKLLYQPMLEVIDERKASVARQLQEAQTMRERAQTLLDDHARKEQAFHREVERNITQQVQDMEAIRTRQLAALDSELAAVRQKHAAIESRRAQEMQQKLQHEADRKSLALVSALLARLSDDALDQKLIDMFLVDLQLLPEAQRMAIRDEVQRPDARLTLVMARPRPPQDEWALKNQIAEALGCPPQMDCTVDSTLTAGLRVQAGPWILAASIADELVFFAGVPLHGP